MIPTINEATLALNQWTELSIVSKATIMLVMGLALARLARHTRASVRHFMLTVTFAALLALPLIIFTVPAVVIEVPVPPTDGPITVSNQAPPSDDLRRPTSSMGGQTVAGGYRTSVSSDRSWLTLVRWVWIPGAILFFVPFAFDLWRLRRIRRDGLPWTEARELTKSLAAKCGIVRSVDILRHEDIAAPVVCGAMKPVIVLPYDASEWSEDDLRRALVHELEHLRRNDWTIHLTARIICALYWFHPLVWMAWRRMRLEAERACDDAVVLSVECTDYADQLVSLAGRLSKAHAYLPLCMANRSDLSRRVSSVLDASQQRGRMGLWTAATLTIMATLVTFSISPVRAVAQRNRQNASTTKEAESKTERARAGSSARLDRSLVEAAASGDIEGIDGLLQAGANVNCAVSGDGSPLIVSARNGRLATVQLLLDRGADPNLMVPGDGNPLIMAAREGHTEIVAFLLDRGANIDQIVPGDENALIQASDRGYLEVVKLLVARGADVNARAWVEPTPDRPNGEWRTPLNRARKAGHHPVVEFLLAAGARD